MGHAFVPGLRCDRRTKIRKVRELPLEGEILVSQGSSVSAADKVARALLPGDLSILRIPEKMGLQVSEVLDSLESHGILEGAVVLPNQKLCEHRGLFGLFTSRFLSPVAGTVEFISRKVGHVGLRQAPREVSLSGYISGKVVSLERNKAVPVETEAAFIQGIFGVGGEKHGILAVLDIDPDKQIQKDDLPVDIRGRVIVGGSSPTVEALSKAREGGAVGFVTGSIDDTALAAYLGYDIGIALTGDEDLSMTLIITEGFGSLRMSARVCELLKEFDGYEVSINGATQVRAGAVRPEIIIPHDRPDSGGRAEDDSGLYVGRRIRIIRVPYFGQEATVTELPMSPEKIGTGAVTRVLRAQLSSGEIVTVPRANVELLWSA